MHVWHRLLNPSLLKLLSLCLAALNICNERPDDICSDLPLVAYVKRPVAGNVKDDQLVALRLGEAADLAGDASVGSREEAERHGVNTFARFDVVLLSYLLQSCTRSVVGS